MASALERIQAYRDKKNQKTNFSNTSGLSALERIQQYRQQNPYDPNKDKEYLLSQRKKLQTQLNNYEREEKTTWWDEDKNVFENVGNVLYKTFAEKQTDKYKDDEEYKKIQQEYQRINQAIEDYTVENKQYSKGVLGGFEKVADTISGNAMSSIKGIESSVNKLTGQPTTSNKITYEERLAQKVREETTGLGGVGLDLVGSFTRMIPQMVAPNPVTATAVGFANYGGSAYNDAKREGYSEEQATIYGLTVGGLETAMSKVLGGFENVYGKSALGKLTNKIMQNVIKSEVMRKTLSGAVGEFSEEYLQQFLEPIVKNTILGEENGADFWNTMKDDIGAGLKQLSRQFFNLENLYAGGLGTLSSIGLQLPMNISQSINSNQNNSQTTQKTSNEITLEELVQREQNNKNNVNLPILDNSGNIVNSNKFQYVKSDNSKIDNLRKSANQYFKNSVETQNLVNTIEKVIGDKNYSVVFDNSIKNKNGQSVNAQITTNKNGEIEIKINPNSQRAGEFLLTHEITHAIETDSMKNLILDYASKNTEFNQALESLKQTYGVDDVSSEVIADISGQLLGNQEFINSLTIQNTAESKSIIKTIYENIKRLLNTLTKNGRYRNFVQDLEIKWRDAYKTTTTEQAVSNLNNETKYMMTGLKGMENGITTSAKYVDIKDRYDAALYLENKNYSNEKIRQITGWFKDKEGNWEFEISDQHTKFKIQPKTNAKYKLSDIFEANTLYEMYPELKNITVSFKNMKSNGKYFSVTNEISINNKLINSIDSMKGTLLHEIQHYIQKIEGLPEGTSLFFGNEQYANNKGEIEAADTKNRRNLNVEQRKLIIPESAKQNPIHPNRQNILNHKRSFIEKIGDKIYNRFGGESNEIFEEFNEKNQNQNIEIYDSNNRNRLKELDNSSFSLKEKQLDIILNNNPAGNDNVTWIRKIDDIKTFEETLQDEDWQGYDEFNPDYTLKMANEAVDSGKIIVYSSYPIEQGIFVTPSKMEAESYSGTGKVYSKEVSLKDVAWIDPTQGQYAKVDSTKYSNNNQNWQDYLEQNYKATGTRTEMRKLLPTQEDIKKMELKNTKLPTRKTLNPTEISNLTKEDANTTPILQNANVSTGNGKSKFASNIKNKTNMLNEDSKNAILSDNDVNYYREVTNEESLNQAFERLNTNGKSEVERWFRQDSENANSTDVAEGWILLKQYQDQISKATDLNTKNELNRSMVQVAKKLRDMGTKAGQTVQAFNILNRLTPEGMVYYAQSELDEAFQHMVKNKSQDWINKYKSDFELTPQETQFILDTMQEVSKMQDGYDKRVKLAEIQKLMTDKLPPQKGAGIKAWMRISMLFNPKTQVRNVLGNAFIAPVNSFSDLIGSVVDKRLAKSTNVRTTGTTSLKNYGKGLKKGLFESYNDFRRGINTRNIEGNRFEISQGRSFNNKTKIGSALNKVDNFLSFLLDAGDRGFYEASFVNSINNQMVLNNTTEVTQDMIDIATSEALQRTWQDNNNYTRFVMNIRKMMNAGKEYGLGDILIPFAKTPANLTKAIVDYSPVGLINSINKGIRFKRSLTNGQFTPQLQHDFVQTLGKATAGSMLYVLGYALAKAGVTSGESDEDKDVSNFLKNTLGINSYSIKIGNNTFTYDWVQPLAAPLAITANIVQKDKENQSLVENIISSLDTAGSILLEQSFMDSLNTVFNNNDGVVTGLQEALLELPSRAVPTVFKQIADMVDGTQRTSFEYNKPLETAVNKVKAKIPFLSQTLSPSVDTLGRDIQKYGGNNNIFNVFFNPANINVENINESASEIYRLYQATGDKTIMPRVAPYYINQDGSKITLSASEKAKYQSISGQIIEDNVNDLLDDDIYNAMNDENKAEIINKIVNFSYNKAREEVLNIHMSDEYNKINMYINDGGTPSDYYTNKEEIDYSYENPSKYSTITQITTYAKYQNYNDAIKDIKEQYEDSNQRKYNVINYVNGLNLSIPQKAMLIKLNYSSFKDYDNQIIEYINSQNMTIAEKTTILEQLGFTVRNGRVYS